MLLFVSVFMTCLAVPGCHIFDCFVGMAEISADSSSPIRYIKEWSAGKGCKHVRPL
jgi:hypothetical protein